MSSNVVDLTVNAGTRTVTVRNIDRGAAMKYVPFVREQLVAYRNWRLRNGQRGTPARESVTMTLYEGTAAARALLPQSAFDYLAAWMYEKRAVPAHFYPQVSAATANRTNDLQTLVDVYAAARILDLGANVRAWRNSLLSHLSVHILTTSQIREVWKKLAMDVGVVSRMINAYYDQLDRDNISEQEDYDLYDFLKEKEPELFEEFKYQVE